MQCLVDSEHNVADNMGLCIYLVSNFSGVFGQHFINLSNYN